MPVFIFFLEEFSMKKILLFLVAASVIGSAVFAGGSQAGSTQSASGVPVITSMGWGAVNDDPTSLESRRRAEYEKAHNVKIDAQSVPYDDYAQKVITLIAANALPDLMALEEHRVLEFGAQGVLKDLRALFAEDGQNIDDVFVAGQMAKTGDNKVYGIGVGGALNLLYYNKGLLQKAGIAPPPDDVTKPWTWDQYLSALIKLTKDNRGRTPADAGFDPNNVVQWGTAMNDWWIYTLPMLYSAGTSVFAPDGMSLAISKPAGIESIQKFADLKNRHHVAAPEGTFPSNAAALVNDQLATYIDGNFAAGGFVVGEGDSAVPYDVGMAQIPTQSGKASNMVWGAATTVTRNASKEAFAYFKHTQDSLRQIEDNEQLAQELGFSKPIFYVPVTKNVINDPALAARLAKFANPRYTALCADIVDKASRVGENITVKNFSQIVYEYVQPAIELVVTGDATAAEAFKDLDAQTRGLFQGVY
jgi:multiple sugar transport system substrate-binding protein